jgi:undecaprenyl-diphosphatase
LVRLVSGWDVVKLWQYVSFGIAAVLLGGFGVVADEVSEGSTLALDNAILLALREPNDPSNPLGPPWLEEAARDITSLGSPTILGILVAAFVGYLFLTGRKWTAGFLATSVVGGAIVSTVLKLLFDRPRPDIPGVTRVFSASFPSGHAALSAVVYLALGAILSDMTSQRPAKVFLYGVALFLTLIVGMSRVYLGVHFPSDVVAGWSLGAAWALLTHIALGSLKRDRS